MAYTDPVTGQRIGGSAQMYGTKWPTTRDERHAAYRERWRAYRQEPFTDDDIARLALFVAKDAADRVTAVTQRLVRDYAFVCDVDARAIATDGVTLLARPDAPPGTLDAGVVEWRASHIDKKLPEWALNLCVEGKGCLEVVQRPGDAGPAIVWHHATEVDVEYDSTGLTVVRAVVIIDEPPPVEIRDDGTAHYGGQAVRYMREITPSTVRVWRDGQPVPEESGANPLGIVPVIEVTFGSAGPGGMPTNAAHGLGDVLALINSTLMQIQTIGSRNGNPMLLAIGARLGAGADLQAQGRILAAPADADIRWLELSMQGLGALVTQISSVVDMTRQTMPEFLFMDSGANASGTALGYRAGAFVAKMQPVRGAMYAALAQAVAIAAVMRRGGTWSEDADVFAVDGGSALPMDIGAGATLRQGLVDAGMLRRADAVAWLQAARIAPQGIDPDAYAASAIAELEARTADLRDALARLEAMQGATTLAEVRQVVDAEPVEVPEPRVMVEAIDADGNGIPDEEEQPGEPG